MKVFIQKIKGRDRVRIKHGDQIFTIDDYNGYKGDEIEWLKNCVERFFTVYDASVKKSADQSETSSRQQENETKTEIWHKWDSKPDLSYNDAAYGAMLEYAHQQTADKDREIEELKAEVTALKLVIDELTDGDCLKQSKAKLSGEIVKLKAEAERLRKDDGWVSIDNEKPLPDKACQCYCPDEPIDVIQIAFWDDKFGFVDNNDCPVNATKWKYIKIY